MSITVGGGTKAPTVDKPVYQDGETYFVRVVQVVDLGLQDGGEYQGNKKPDAEEILLTFEFGEVLNGEGKPGWLSVNLPLPGRWEETGKFKGVHIKSNLYKYLEVLYPEGLFNGGKSKDYRSFSYSFDWNEMLGKPCQLTVKVTDDGAAYINKGSISRVPAKFISSVEPLKNEPVVFNLDTASPEEWMSLFPWVRNKIKASLDPAVVEKAEMLDKMAGQTETNPSRPVENKTKPKSAKVTAADFDDDIPF